ncbi:Bile acid transporter [Planctomycetales bacterium 10988]|nr:Bile acid transporter [Planctomycetales bacterium 10988]
METVGTLITRFYPFWLVGTAIVAYVLPSWFIWFTGPWIRFSLAVVMLAMGMTLTIADFRRIFEMPRTTVLGLALQFTIMPLIGWSIAYLLQLETDLAIGLILLASCPGGTASNMIALLAKANVALSVVLTMTSTLASFIMTPLWCQWLAGHYVPVDSLAIAISTLKIVVAPVLIGVLLNWRFPDGIKRVQPVGPPVAVVALCLITGAIVAGSVELIAQYAAQLLLAATLLHVLGFILGFTVTRLFRYSDEIARTVSIEVGMQNGGMATVLAKTHFTANPLAAIPMVFSAVIQNVIGSVIGNVWASREVGKTSEVQSIAMMEEPP